MPTSELRRNMHRQGRVLWRCVKWFGIPFAAAVLSVLSVGIENLRANTVPVVQHAGWAALTAAVWWWLLLAGLAFFRRHRHRPPRSAVAPQRGETAWLGPVMARWTPSLRELGLATFDSLEYEQERARQSVSMFGDEAGEVTLRKDGFWRDPLILGWADATAASATAHVSMVLGSTFATWTDRAADLADHLGVQQLRVEWVDRPQRVIAVKLIHADLLAGERAVNWGDQGAWDAK